MSIRHTRLLW